MIPNQWRLFETETTQTGAADIALACETGFLAQQLFTYADEDYDQIISFLDSERIISGMWSDDDTLDVFILTEDIALTQKIYLEMVFRFYRRPKINY